MFNLNTAVESWREDLGREEAMTREVLEELEGHLLDIIDSLAASKLSIEERFLIATHRIGHGDKLQREFAKSNQSAIWKKRFLWMLGGFLVVAAIDSAISLFSNSMLMVGSYAGLQLAHFTIVALLLKLAPVVFGAYLLLAQRASIKQRLFAFLAGSMATIRSHYIIAAMLWLLLYLAGNVSVGLVREYSDTAAYSALASAEIVFKMAMVIAIPSALVALYSRRKSAHS